MNTQAHHIIRTPNSHSHLSLPSLTPPFRSKTCRGRRTFRLTVNGWIRVRSNELTAALVKRLQRELDALLQLKVGRWSLSLLCQQPANITLTQTQ